MTDKEQVSTDPIVFISYSSENYAEAEMIRDDLEADGIKCWMASRDIVGSTDYLEVIPQTIRATQLLLLVLSAQSMASDHVYREVRTAVDAKLPILPVRIDSAKIEGRWEFLLTGAQWINGSPRLAPALGRIRHDLRETLSRRGVVIPLSLPRILRVVTLAVAWILIGGLTALVALLIHGYWFNLVPPSRYAQALLRHPIPLMLVLLPLFAALTGQYVAHAKLRSLIKMDALFAVGQGMAPLVRTSVAVCMAVVLLVMVWRVPATVVITLDSLPAEHDPRGLTLVRDCDARRFVETTRAYALRLRVGAYNGNEPVGVGVEYVDPDSPDICRVWVGSGFDTKAEKGATNAEKGELDVGQDDKLPRHRARYIVLRSSLNDAAASHLALVTLIHPRTGTLGRPARMVVRLQDYPSVTQEFPVTEDHWR